MSENPGYVLATTFKSTPTYLNCHVSVKIEAILRADLMKSNFYHEPPEPDDDEEEEVGETVDQQTVDDYYRKQYQQTIIQLNDTNKIPSQIAAPSTKHEEEEDEEEEDDEDDKSRSRRSVRESLSFEWLKDGLVVASSGVGDNQVVNRNGYALFPNGTLRFLPSNLTAGEYRCNVSYVEKRFTIGPILSPATVVEMASKLAPRL